MERIGVPAAIKPLCHARKNRDQQDRLATLDATTVLSIPGQSGLAGVYQGGEAILDLVDRLTQITNGTLRLTPSHTVDMGNGESWYVRSTATRRERRLAVDIELRVVVDGHKVSEIRVATSNQPQFDQFWS